MNNPGNSSHSSSTRIIEILVTPTGETSLETRGFTGVTCREASRFLERALGKTVGERLTAEFHQQAASQQARNNQQR